MTVDIRVGDCRELLPVLASSSIDSCVTDPPYGLGFMGKDWDHGIPGVHFWQGVLRALKPGAHLVAFGGTRTHHRLMCAIEDAGFEIRDTLGWLYGSGFPKSKNIGDGRGTALKPAWEPIVLARKPLVGTVAANVEAHGTGALDIDGCRIETDDDLDGGAYGDRGARTVSPSLNPSGMNRKGATTGKDFVQPLGRWPANIVHDGSEEVLAVFPDTPGQIADASTITSSRKTQNVYGDMKRGNGREGEPSADNDNEGGVGFKMKPGARRGDEGSAARFFYCAKASREDRNEGLSGFGERPINWSSGDQSPGTFQSPNTHRASENHHPTVKPTDLMRWLCRLVTPPGGIILDPFMGSGSTGKAAYIEGFNFIGMELEREYAEIAEARIRGVAPLSAQVTA